MKNIIFILFVFLIVVSSSMHLAFSEFATNSKQSDKGMRAVFEHSQLEDEGRKLEEEFKFEEALQKYELAVKKEEKFPKILRGGSVFRVSMALQAQEKYQEALSRLRNNPYRNPKHEYGNDRIAELEALVEYQKTGKQKSVYDYINQYQEKYKKGISPKGYDSTRITTLFRLYDTIGDYDAGIKLVDECLEYFKKQDIKKHGHYKPGYADADFLKVREAFEQDRKNGTKGSVTKVLIQSQHFPW